MDFKIDYSCPKCRQQINIAGGYLDNTETVKLTCPKGHKTEAFVVVPRFSLYFDKGVRALKKGYYYEGYSWIYTSLEVFRKIFLKAHLSVIAEIPIEAINKTFDGKFKLSENIYGAYASAYLSYFGFGPDLNKKSPYPILGSEEIARRNAMFHMGSMPSIEEIEKDCYKIYQHMKFGYHNFVDNKVPIITLYYGNCYHYWAESRNVNSDDVLSQNISLLNSDLGVFQSNNLGIFNRDGTGDFLTYQELIENASDWFRP